MINNNLLPVPMKYCKQILMELRFVTKSEKIEKHYYFPELNSWISRISRLQNSLDYRKMSLNTWKTKWYLGMSEYQMDTVEWAKKFVDTFYSDRYPDTKYTIMCELLKNKDYICDFAITKRDLIDLYYKTRKDIGRIPKNYDWSKVPDRLIRLRDSFIIISNEINPKTGKPRGEGITCFLRLINEMRDISDSPLNIDKRKENIKVSFFKKAIEKHNGKYDYSESEYINSTTPIKIRCDCGNIFFQIPSQHLLGCGCPVCGNKKEYKIVNWNEERDNLENYLLEGKTYEELGKIYGCSGHQIGIISEKLGLSHIKDQLREEERNKYIKYLEEGYSEIEISKITGTTASSVCAKLKTLGIDVSKYIYPKYFDFIERADEIKELLISGESVVSISKMFNVNIGIIWHVLKVKNIKIKHITKIKEDLLVEKIKDLALKGYNLSTISEITKKSKSIISKLVISYNIRIKASISKGEYYVQTFLDNNKDKFLDIKIHYKHEDVLPSLIYVDFELINKKGKRIILEYNGDQHYRFIKRFHKTLEKFERRKERDRKLREYCIKNNILFVEIPFIFNTQEKVSEFLDKVLLKEIDPNTLVNYESLFK